MGHASALVSQIDQCCQFLMENQTRKKSWVILALLLTEYGKFNGDSSLVIHQKARLLNSPFFTLLKPCNATQHLNNQRKPVLT